MAGTNYGFESYVGLAREATWGTESTGTEDTLRIISAGIKPQGPRIPRESSGNLSAHGIYPGTQYGMGPVTIPMIYEGAECFFEYHFGASGGPSGAGPFTWEYTPSLDIYDADGLTVNQVYGPTGGAAMGYKWAGSKVNQLTFSCEKDKPLIVTAEFMSKSLAFDSTPGTASYPWDTTEDHDRPVLESELTMLIDGGAWTTNTPISWSLTSNNNLRGDNPALGTGTVTEQKRNGRHVITGEWTGDFDGNAIYALYSGNTSFKLEFNYLTTYTGDGGPYQLKIELPQCRVMGEQPPEISGPGIVQTTVPFQAIYDATATYAIKVTLINGRDALETAA